MSLRLLALSIGAVLSAGAAAKDDSTQTWIVRFAEAPLASYAGPSTAQDPIQARLKATSPLVTGARKLDPRSADSMAYLGFLKQRRAARLDKAEALLARPLPPRFVYDMVLNGVALDLTPNEAEQLRSLPGVAAVEPEVERWLQTDAGPDWIGAPGFWANPDLSASRGEGIVVGVIDTGVRTSHPSFAGTASDGYVHSNPRGQFLGLCTPVRCNGKLIGIHEFTDEGARDGSDANGHGSHVAGTAVGNPVNVSVDFGDGVSRQRLLRGVAPRANLISYKACKNATDDSPGTCPTAGLLAAINQAVADQVDVINYSIGGKARDPWSSGQTDALAMLNARQAGIVVVVAAGNEGPAEGSITSPGNAPWVLTVAAASHDRALSNRVLDLQGGDTPAPGGGELAGVGLTPGIGLTSIVRDPLQPLCSTGSDLDFPPTGVSNPWSGQVFAGQLVVCQRGVQARVAKSNNVRLAGGGGMILLNGPEDGESIVADAHSIPATHLGNQAGQQLLTWLASGSGHRGRLEGIQLRSVPQFADVLASFSGLGAARFAEDALKPDISAPGVSILAAAHDSNGATLKGGTSMATPHVAGAVALLLAARPSWGPAQVESVLMGSARPSVRRSDGVGLASPFEQGAGQVDLSQALSAGLYFPNSRSQFVAANPSQGGQLASLNRPSLAHGACFEQCSLQRTVVALRDSEWNVELELPDGALAVVTPSEFELAEGESQVLSLNFDLRAQHLPGTWVHGAVRLVSSSAEVPDVRMPLSLFADPGGDVDRITINAAAEAGAVDVQLGSYVALPEPTFSVSELATPMQRNFSLSQDPTRNDPYDSFGPGTRVDQIRFSEGGGPGWLEVELSSPSALDGDLFVGLDIDGNGLPSADEELCDSTSALSSERCLIEVEQTSADATYWILVQNVQGSGGSAVFNMRANAVRLAPADAGIGSIGPGAVASGEDLDLRLFWDMPFLEPGHTRSGYLLPGNIPGREGLLGPVRIDVIRSAVSTSVSRALVPNRARRLELSAGAAQDRYFIDVPPNASRLALSSEGVGNVSLYLARDAQPGNPQVGPAPPRSSAAAVADGIGANKSVSLAGAQLTPGRWYLTPVNTGTFTAKITLTATLEYDQPRADPAPGAWYNPARSGAGIYVYRAEGVGVWGMVWYTYEADGSPVWYLGSTPKPGPDAGIWTIPLERYSWNGVRARGVPVGEAVLSLTEDDRLQFSWNVLGETGSEPLQLIPQPTCAAGPLDVSGLWYSPSRPGFGYSVLVAQSVESFVSYLYDGEGRPRWLSATSGPFGSAETLELRQYSGFCPLCAFTAPSTQVVGSLTRSYAAGSIASIALQADFLAPLSGSWSQSAATISLADLGGCP